MSELITQPPFQEQQSPQRKVSFLLGLGIFLFPLIFSWFTLRSGHTTLARAISFIWLVLSLIFLFANPSPNTSNNSTSTSTSTSTSSSQNEPATLTSSTEPVEEVPAEEARVEVSQPSVIQISANDLFQHYEANEVAADRNFKGQLLEVSGTVQSIDSGLGDGANVHFNVGDQFGLESVMASGDGSFDDYAASLSKGQKITLRCEGAGEVIGQPFLDKCTPI